MKELNRKAITWQSIKPDSFPCHLCREEEADYLVKYSYKAIIIQIPLCQSCADMPISRIETELGTS
ncbi:MAG: hypothetical protein SWO11_22845 [Thermodesulfobacteriota bacterium]|nr:hypothetical protein [Thermodesulfobacteriota bacterium]